MNYLKTFGHTSDLSDRMRNLGANAANSWKVLRSCFGSSIGFCASAPYKTVLHVMSVVARGSVAIVVVAICLFCATAGKTNWQVCGEPQVHGYRQVD